MGSPLTIASMTLFGLILSRWNGFLAFYARRLRVLPLVIMALACLPASVLIGVLGMGRGPDPLVIWVCALIQMCAVVWGMMFVAIPPLVDLQDALAVYIGADRVFWGQSALAVAFVVACLVAMVFLLPWWVLLALLAVSAAKTSLQLRHHHA